MKWYAGAQETLLAGEWDWLTSTIKVMLTTSSYTPDQGADRYKSDITNETSGDGYTAGGKTLSGKTQTYAAGTKRITFDAADVTWTDSSITARTLVIYADITGDATIKPLIGYHTFAADEASASSDFILEWHTDGILTLTAS